MAKRAVQRNKTVLNPMFAIPDGVEEFVYDDRELSPDEGYAYESEDDSGSVDVGDDVDYSDSLAVPDIYGVVEYIPRRSPDGSMVYDAILDVSEPYNGTSFEFKVATI